MSCVGTASGAPLAGDRMLFADSISTWASSCASIESGMCTAIWSPSKSALKAVQTSGWISMALPSTRIGSNAWIPRRWSVGARLRRIGCSLMTSSRMSQTSGRSFSTNFLAALMDDVQVRGREPTAFERHQREELRRNDRHDFQDHPIGLVAGLQERLNDLEALHDLLPLLDGRLAQHLGAEITGHRIKVHVTQEL